MHATWVGGFAFLDCSGLTNIAIGPSNLNYTSISGVLFDKATTALIQCPCGKSGDYIIPNSVTNIGDFAFSYCSGLTSIVIPDSVTTIGGSSFGYCGSLTNITIPDSVTVIGQNAFVECSNLTFVTIPDSVTEIQGYTFEFCTNLKSMVIPDSIVTIGTGAFEYCTSLTNVIVGDSVNYIGDWAFESCVSSTNIFFWATHREWIPHCSAMSLRARSIIYLARPAGPAPWVAGQPHPGGHRSRLPIPSSGPRRLTLFST